MQRNVVRNSLSRYLGGQHTTPLELPQVSPLYITSPTVRIATNGSGKVQNWNGSFSIHSGVGLNDLINYSRCRPNISLSRNGAALKSRFGSFFEDEVANRIAQISSASMELAMFPNWKCRHEFRV
jgi:hypothetical protein